MTVEKTGIYLFGQGSKTARHLVQPHQQQAEAEQARGHEEQGTDICSLQA